MDFAAKQALLKEQPEGMTHTQLRAKTEMKTVAYEVAKDLRLKKQKAVEEYFKQTCSFKPAINSSRNAQLLQNRTQRTREPTLTKREEEDIKERERQLLIKKRNAEFVDKLKSQYKQYLEQPKRQQSPVAALEKKESASTYRPIKSSLKGRETGGVTNLIRDAREKALITQLRLQEEREYRQREREFVDQHPGMDILTAKKMFREFREEELREQAATQTKMVLEAASKPKEPEIEELQSFDLQTNEDA